MSFSWDVRLTLTWLQGIVNKSQPRLSRAHDYFDELWLNWLRERGDVDQVSWLDVGQVFELFLSETKVVFITAPAIPATINHQRCHHAGECAPRAGRNTSHPGQFDRPMGTCLIYGIRAWILGFMNWKKDSDAYRW